MKIIRLVLPVFVLFFMVSCGYTLVGKGSFLPPHIKSMGIPAFKDKSGRQELSEILTKTVTDKMIRQSRLNVISSESGVDAVLKGEVLGFRQTPIDFDSEGYTTRYQITLTMGVVLKDLVENKDIYKNPNFVFRSEYEVQEDFEDFFDATQEGVEEIAVDFADRLVAALLEGF